MKIRSYVLPLVATAVISGCSTPQPLEDFSTLSLSPYTRHTVDASYTLQTKTVREVLAEHFTPNAVARLADILVVKGRIFGEGFAVGANTMSRIGGLLTGNGWSDKIVISRSRTFSEEELLELLVHEYLHRAIRRGLIDKDAFETAYVKACTTYVRTCALSPTPHLDFSAEVYTEQALARQSVGLKMFGVGDLEERICIVGGLVAVGGHVSDELREQYRDVLIFKQQNTPVQDTASGSK